jgi:HTH-type transcriptional regulator / antitoxin HigA
VTTLAKALDFSEPHLLRNEAEYDAAVAEVDTLLERDPAPSTPEHDRLAFLSVLIETYDEAHYPMGETSTPQSVVDFMLEQRDMDRAKLAPLMGGRSRVSDFFAEKRRLSLTQIQRLRDLLDVPADLLIERERRAGRRPRRQPSRAKPGRRPARRATRSRK